MRKFKSWVLFTGTHWNLGLASKTVRTKVTELESHRALVKLR